MNYLTIPIEIRRQMLAMWLHSVKYKSVFARKTLKEALRMYSK